MNGNKPSIMKLGTASRIDVKNVIFNLTNGIELISSIYIGFYNVFAPMLASMTIGDMYYINSLKSKMTNEEIDKTTQYNRHISSIIRRDFSDYMYGLEEAKKDHPETYSCLTDIYKVTSSFKENQVRDYSLISLKRVTESFDELFKEIYNMFSDPIIDYWFDTHEEILETKFENVRNQIISFYGDCHSIFEDESNYCIDAFISPEPVEIYDVNGIDNAMSTVIFTLKNAYDTLTSILQDITHYTNLSDITGNKEMALATANYARKSFEHVYSKESKKRNDRKSAYETFIKSIRDRRKENAGYEEDAYEEKDDYSPYDTEEDSDPVEESKSSIDTTIVTTGMNEGKPNTFAFVDLGKRKKKNDAKDKETPTSEEEKDKT